MAINNMSKLHVKNVEETFDRFNWRNDQEDHLKKLGFDIYFHLIGGEDELVWMDNLLVVITDAINYNVFIFVYTDKYKDSRLSELHNIKNDIGEDDFEYLMSKMKFEKWSQETPGSNTKKMDIARDMELYVTKEETQDLMILYYKDHGTFEVLKKIEKIDLMSKQTTRYDEK